jgi:predicted SnoaL-like aldol condensation-catalyzing enzyme
MSSKRKERIRTLLKGIETGDPRAVAVVNQKKYIQHNPQTHEGGEGLAALFKRLSKTSPRVNIVRTFEDGEFVFAHTEYDFSSRKIGFEVFRFEGDQVVEHWDNIQERMGPNSSGHSMVDGATEVANIALTETNREVVSSFANDILVNRRMESLGQYVEEGCYTEHSPEIDLAEKAIAMKYERTHRVLAEGNFVLAVSEGTRDGAHTAFYDLFRIAESKLVEHWDTIEAIAPRREWKNDNGKF